MITYREFVTEAASDQRRSGESPDAHYRRQIAKEQSKNRHYGHWVPPEHRAKNGGHSRLGHHDLHTVLKSANHHGVDHVDAHDDNLKAREEYHKIGGKWHQTHDSRNKPLAKPSPVASH